MGEYDEFVASLIALGEETVRSKLAQGLWANKRKSWAEQWLQAIQSEHDAKNQASGIEIAKEANAIAKANLKAAQSAKNAAWVAACAAIVAAIFAALAYVFAKP